jgi:hypothetical protein
MQRVLVPRLPAEKMKNALRVRGDVFVDKCRNKVRCVGCLRACVLVCLCSYVLVCVGVSICIFWYVWCADVALYLLFADAIESLLAAPLVFSLGGAVRSRR